MNGPKTDPPFADAQDPGGRFGFPQLCIVGSKGKMGRLFLRECARAGYPTRGLDRSFERGAQDEEDRSKVLSSSRLVLLCVPIATLRSALEEIAPHLGPEHLLMDITSVKVFPLRWMEAAFSGQVVGAHPLFGPRPSPEEMRVALVRGKKAGESACLEAERLFQRIGCATFWSTAERHDAGVGLAQSLNFTVSAAFFCALSRQEGIEPFLTPSFKRHLEAARKHLTADTGMFCAFTAMNPEYPKALAGYLGILEEVQAGNLARIAAEAAVWYARSS
ncbi:MAG: prephenate dehydrogenase/arogenate dehydrogenase family protein [Deltaproteobacteria bacterium]|jgi:prephenate dehydrogenase|nr:prephenate dehydrogenase/arogenate dehydrogenase family protein [Deltaproteobacteria bacterium]